MSLYHLALDIAKRTTNQAEAEAELTAAVRRDGKLRAALIEYGVHGLVGDAYAAIRRIVARVPSEPGDGPLPLPQNHGTDDIAGLQSLQQKYLDGYRLRNGLRLGDARRADLEVEIDTRQKLAASNAYNARWLGRVCDKLTNDKQRVRDVLTNDEIEGLRAEDGE